MRNIFTDLEIKGHSRQIESVTITIRLQMIYNYFVNYRYLFKIKSSILFHTSKFAKDGRWKRKTDQKSCDIEEFSALVFFFFQNICKKQCLIYSLKDLDELYIKRNSCIEIWVIFQSILFTYHYYTTNGNNYLVISSHLLTFPTVLDTMLITLETMPYLSFIKSE